MTTPSPTSLLRRPRSLFSLERMRSDKRVTWLTIVGIGPRSGRREIRHLLSTTRAPVLLGTAQVRGEDQRALVSGFLPCLQTTGRAVR